MLAGVLQSKKTDEKGHIGMGALLYGTLQNSLENKKEKEEVK